MFLGTQAIKVDDKGRIFLPAKYRDGLAGGIVMTRGQEHCLYVFPKDEFFRNAERWKSAPMSNKDARAFLRVFLDGASDEVPDRQGRVTIPPTLRTYAELGRECVIKGQLDRLEIWAKERHEAYIADVETVFADATEEVLPGLF